MCSVGFDYLAFQKKCVRYPFLPPSYAKYSSDTRDLINVAAVVARSAWVATRRGEAIRAKEAEEWQKQSVTSRIPGFRFSSS